MQYVALLRGINVGGKNKLDMKALKKVFEQAGMESVKTYINSGNIIFSSSELSAELLAKALEQAIYENFNLLIRVLIYNFEDYEKIALAVPETWTNDDQMKSDVLFLWKEINNENVLDQLAAKPEIDQVLYVPGAVLWAVDRQLVTKSGMMKVAGSVLYKQMTIRNINTVRKIYELMKDSKK